MGLHAAHHLPLRHRIDRVDMEHPRLAVLVTLVHRVYPQIAGLPLRIRLPPLADGHLARWGVRHVHPHTRVVLESRRLKMCAAEMSARFRNSGLPKTVNSRCRMRRTPGPDRSSWAASTDARRRMSSAV